MFTMSVVSVFVLDCLFAFWIDCTSISIEMNCSFIPKRQKTLQNLSYTKSNKKRTLYIEQKK